MTTGYITNHLPVANYYPPARSQQNNSVTTSPSSETGRNTMVNFPVLPSLDRLTTQQKTLALKSHLITVLGHFLAQSKGGLRYVVHGGMAMAIHLKEVRSSEAAAEKDYHFIQQLSEEAGSLFPLSWDKLDDIDLSINSQQSGINEMCRYLEQSLNEGELHESLTFTATPSSLINTTLRVEIPGEKNKTDCIFRTIGEKQSIIIKYENEIILNIDINSAPKQTKDKPPFQYPKPYCNRYTLKNVNFGNVSFEINVCKIDQLISNLQYAFKNTAYEIPINENKFLHKLKLLEQFTSRNLLNHSEKDLTSNCLQQIMKLLQNKKLTMDKEVQISSEVKEQGTDTFEYRPTLTDKSINTITTDLMNQASNTDNEHLQQVNQEVQTSYPETKDTCVNSVTATFLTVGKTTDNTTGPDSEDHLSQVNPVKKKAKKKAKKKQKKATHSEMRKIIKNLHAHRRTGMKK